jgi:hypothetical protein
MQSAVGINYMLSFLSLLWLQVFHPMVTTALTCNEECLASRRMITISEYILIHEGQKQRGLNVFLGVI